MFTVYVACLPNHYHVHIYKTNFACVCVEIMFFFIWAGMSIHNYNIQSVGNVKHTFK